jgi:hypothetical protein
MLAVLRFFLRWCENFGHIQNSFLSSVQGSTHDRGFFIALLLLLFSFCVDHFFSLSFSFYGLPGCPDVAKSRPLGDCLL